MWVVVVVVVVVWVVVVDGVVGGEAAVIGGADGVLSQVLTMDAHCDHRGVMCL